MTLAELYDAIDDLRAQHGAAAVDGLDVMAIGPVVPYGEGEFEPVVEPNRLAFHPLFVELVEDRRA